MFLMPTYKESKVRVQYVRWKIKNLTYFCTLLQWKERIQQSVEFLTWNGKKFKIWNFLYVIVLAAHMNRPGGYRKHIKPTENHL